MQLNFKTFGVLVTSCQHLAVTRTVVVKQFVDYLLLIQLLKRQEYAFKKLTGQERKEISYRK